MGHENGWIGKLTFVASVVILILLLRNDNNNSGQQDTISVSGSHLLMVAPDEAEVLVRVQTLEDTAAISQQKNKEISTKVIEALKAQGITTDSISTEQYNLFKKEDYVYDKETGESTTKFKGYELDHVIKVKVSDISKIGTIVDSSVEAGANGVDSVIFKLSKDKEKSIKTQVLGVAIQNAKDKANIMATQLGIKIDKPINVYESYYSIQPYNSYNSQKVGEAILADGGTMITPGNVEVSMSVSVVYKIK